MDEFIAVAKALADRNRCRALLALEDRELCACQIMELLGLAPSTVSRHMAQLQQAGLVVSRKEGRWTYYGTPKSDGPVVVRSAISWVRDSLAASSTIKSDRRLLKKILEIAPEERCGNGRKG
ncbi:MAG: metalloregulator ArsR/SmtB family transcription factor [Candidatus Eisenbacteria bacterium]